MDLITNNLFPSSDEKDEKSPLLVQGTSPHVKLPTDLAEEYLASSECQAVESSVQPLVHGVAKSANGQGVLRTCFTFDSYATNILWQVL